MPPVSGRPRRSAPKTTRRLAHPPAEARKGGCRIELPASLRVVVTEGRRELEVRGRVLATAPLDHVTLRERDEVVFRTHYAEAAGRDFRYGFCCTLVQPAADADNTWSFDIVAQQRDGTTERADFVVAYGAGMAQAEVRSGPTGSGIALNDPLPPAIM